MANQNPQAIEVGSNDRLLFYFAGHGIALDGDDGSTDYLVPQDAHPEDRDTFLPMQDLHQTLTALPPSTGHPGLLLRRRFSLVQHPSPATDTGGNPTASLRMLYSVSGLAGNHLGSL